MTEPVPATIRWLRPSEGGRRTIPTGPQYMTLVRFEDDDTWQQQGWDLVVRFDRPLDRSGLVMLTNVCFLVDEAPTGLLKPGARFELREGHKVVAKGVVLPQTVRVPDQIEDFAAALLG